MGHIYVKKCCVQYLAQIYMQKLLVTFNSNLAGCAVFLSAEAGNSEDRAPALLRLLPAAEDGWARPPAWAASQVCSPCSNCMSPPSVLLPVDVYLAQVSISNEWIKQMRYLCATEDWAAFKKC